MTLGIFVDVLMPPGSRIIGQAIMAWAVAFPDRHAAPAEVKHPCPGDMVLVGRTCVDELPYPNDEYEEPMLGVSAVFEEYLSVPGIWDCERLCALDEKRLCTWSEWQQACDGTPRDKCGGIKDYVDPNWAKVMRRSPRELARLDQHAKASDHPGCVSRHGVRMMTTLEEWVRVRDGYAFSRGFWSREGDCNAINTAHAPNWHGYSNACRCCRDAVLP